jgi:hypothetical protein
MRWIDVFMPSFPSCHPNTMKDNRKEPPRRSWNKKRAGEDPKTLACPHFSWALLTVKKKEPPEGAILWASGKRCQGATPEP